MKWENLDTNMHTGRTQETEMTRLQIKGTPKIASKPSEPRGEARNRLVLTASEGVNPSNTLILDFQP